MEAKKTHKLNCRSSDKQSVKAITKNKRMKSQEGETQMTLPPTISRLLDNNENSSRNSFFSDVDLDERTGRYEHYLKIGFSGQPDLANIPLSERSLERKSDFELDNDNLNLSSDKNYLACRNDFPGQFDVDALSVDNENAMEENEDRGNVHDEREEAEREDSYGFQDVYMEKLPLKKSNKQAYNFANNFVEAARTSQDTLLLSPVPRTASPLRSQRFFNESSNFELPTRSHPHSGSKNVHFMEHDFADNEYGLDSRPVSAVSIESSLFASPQQQRRGDYSFNYKLNQSVLDMKNNNNCGEKMLNNSINSTSNNYNTSTSHRGTRASGSSEQNELSPVGSHAGRHRKPHIEELISNAQNLSLYLDQAIDLTTSTANDFTRNSTRGHTMDGNSERETSMCSGSGNFGEASHSEMESFCMEPSNSSIVSNQYSSSNRHPDSINHNDHHHHHHHHKSQEHPQKKDQKSFGESSEISSFALSPMSNIEERTMIGTRNGGTISTSPLSAAVSGSRPNTSTPHNVTDTGPHKIDDFLISYPLNNNLSLQNDEQSDDTSSRKNEQEDEDLDVEETSFLTKPWSAEEFDTSIMSNYETQDAIELFINMLNYLLTLTKLENQSQTFFEQRSFIKDTFDSFLMKGPASLSYEKFVKNRIQTRCKYSSMIYLNSAYLLLNLLTNYSCHSLPPKSVEMEDGFSENTNTDKANHKRKPAKLQLALPLTESHVHKLIVATLRISSKLIEDNIHSTSFFSKIAGVSKKSLVLLERDFLKLLLSTISTNTKELVLSASMSSIATATTIQVAPSTPTPIPSPLAMSVSPPVLGNDFNWLLINDMKLIEMVNLIN